jgi:hypothetical protein
MEVYSIGAVLSEDSWRSKYSIFDIEANSVAIPRKPVVLHIEISQ